MADKEILAREDCRIKGEKLDNGIYYASLPLGPHEWSSPRLHKKVKNPPLFSMADFYVGAGELCLSNLLLVASNQRTEVFFCSLEFGGRGQQFGQRAIRNCNEC